MDVEVKNGKGTKSVTVMEDGKTRKSVKQLTRKEIKNIGLNRFMPGFFTKCIGDCNKQKTRSKSKARKTMKKKRV